MAKCDRLEVEVAMLEVKMNIGQRWVTTDAAYIQTANYLSEQEFQRALARLEKLVVQRLFELHRMNLSQMGASSWDFISWYAQLFIL